MDFMVFKVGVESKLDLDWIGNVIYVESCTGRPKQLRPPCFPQLPRGSERLDTRQHTNLLFSVRLCEPELSRSGGYLSSFEGYYHSEKYCNNGCRTCSRKRVDNNRSGSFEQIVYVSYYNCTPTFRHFRLMGLPKC